MCGHFRGGKREGDSGRVRLLARESLCAFNTVCSRLIAQKYQNFDLTFFQAGSTPLKQLLRIMVLLRKSIIYVVEEDGLKNESLSKMKKRRKKNT